MRIEIDHPTSKANFSIVTVGDFEIAFSYRTPIGFYAPESGLMDNTGTRKEWEGRNGWVIRENDWGPTTGRHLNELPGRKEDRLPNDAFEEALAKAVEGMTG